MWELCYDELCLVFVLCHEYSCVRKSRKAIIYVISSQKCFDDGFIPFGAIMEQASYSAIK